VDSSHHYQFAYHQNKNTLLFRPDSITLFKSNEVDTLTRFLNGRYTYGTVNWRNTPFLWSALTSPFSINYRYILYPLDTNLNFQADSIYVGDIPALPWGLEVGRAKVEKDQLLYASTANNFLYSPILVSYNFNTRKFKYRHVKDAMQDSNLVLINGDYIYYPGFFPRNNGYLITFDSTKRNMYNNFISFANSTLAELDSDFNIVRVDQLKYPLRDTIADTGLKYVKDVFQLNDNFLVVGTLNHGIPNIITAIEQHNSIGIMMLDSNREILDTLRITKPRAMNLSTGYMNTACWCEGKLMVAGTIDTDTTGSYLLLTNGHAQGLLITRVDTPLNIVWKKQLFLPKTSLRLYDVHCLNGKMILGGTMMDLNTYTYGIFSISVDQNGNFFPLSTQDIVKDDGPAPYPNPFTHTLRLPVSSSPTRSFRLYDVNGRQVLSELAPLTDVSLPVLAPGMYFWSMELANGEIRKGKLVRE
jgi:hypothetical protein